MVTLICCIELLLGYQAKPTSIVLLVCQGIASAIFLLCGLFSDPIYLFWGVPNYFLLGSGLHLRNPIHKGYFPKYYIWVVLIYCISGGFIDILV